MAKHSLSACSHVQVEQVVLVVAGDPVPLATAFGAAFPAAQIHVLLAGRKTSASLELLPDVHQRACHTIEQRVSYLASIDRPQLIVESGNHKMGQKRACFLKLFWFLTEQGRYVVDRLDAQDDPSLADSEGDSVRDILRRLDAADPQQGSPRWERELSDAVESITFTPGRATVHKRGNHFYKLRDWGADTILTRRSGSAWGETIEVLPPGEFESRARVTHHGTGPPNLPSSTMTVPERRLRHYRDVTCVARKLLFQGDYALPETFRHPTQRRLHHHAIAASTTHFGRLKPGAQPHSSRSLDGDHYWLDSEFPGHFGHVMTEVLSLIPGWHRAVELYPGIVPLMSLGKGMERLPDFELDVLRAAGVPTERLRYVRFGEEVSVSSMVASSPWFENPRWVAPELGDTWDAVRAGLPDRGSDLDKIFVSRRPARSRNCLNVQEVEDFFVARGFTVIFPADHDFLDQVAIFAHARVIAGFAGSGLFNAIFAPAAHLIVLAGNGYSALNEYLIASVRGQDLDYFWGESSIRQAAGLFSSAAFAADFTIDLSRHGEALATLLGQRRG